MESTSVFFQVLTHALLFHFDANFVKFHGVFRILGQLKMHAMGHTKIEGFSVYRAGYTQKMPSQSCTYTFVWQKVAYATVLNVF